MPISAWVLLLVSIGLPLALVVPFFLAHRQERRSSGGNLPRSDGGTGR